MEIANRAQRYTSVEPDPATPRASATPAATTAAPRTSSTAMTALFRFRTNVANPDGIPAVGGYRTVATSSTATVATPSIGMNIMAAVATAAKLSPLQGRFTTESVASTTKRAP